MASKNDTIVAGIENLSQDDLVDLYNKLAESYRVLKEENEECKQEYHQQKIQTKILLSSQNHLQNELESINATHEEELQNVIRKNSSVVDHLKISTNELMADKIQLETKVDELNSKLLAIQLEYDKLKTKSLCQRTHTRVSDSFSRNLELENESLQLMLNELKAKLDEAESESSRKQSRLEEFNEQILCLEDNLESKKSEIEEKNDATEILQEKIHELTVELAMLKTAPDDANRKGNSLFAEVDDQRQMMKVILQGERSHYLEMKKSFNAKELEIRRLKRENMNIKQEIEACSSLLSRGNQIATQALTAHVALLLNDNKKLQGLLAENEKQLIDLAGEQKLGWIGSVLSTANNENRDLKDKYFTLMLQKTSIADNLNKIQRELAKARLDCVKLKMLIARLLDANNIQFNPLDFLDLGLDDEVLENLKTEEYEAAVEPFEALSSSSSHELNESTIVLLGGRARLGPLISPPTPKKTKDAKDVSENTNKENIQDEQKSQTTTANLPTVISPAKPMKPLQPKQVASEKDKVVKFSSLVETKVIDSTQEQFEQSKLARKRQAVVVKRIVIPSKAAAKAPEKL